MSSKKKGAARPDSAKLRAHASKTTRNVRLHCSNEAWVTLKVFVTGDNAGTSSTVLESLMASCLHHGELAPDIQREPNRTHRWGEPMEHEPFPVDAALFDAFSTLSRELDFSPGRALAYAIHWAAAYCPPLGAKDDEGEGWKKSEDAA